MAKDAAHRGPATTAVHAGEEPDPRTGAVNVPVHLSTTFWYPELPGGDGRPGRASPYIYSRYENPSLESVEAKIAALEGARHALTFASGMAAIQAVSATLLRPKDRMLVQGGVYGGTSAYLAHELAPMGVQVESGPAVDVPKVRKGTKLVWMESITNPLLRVADVPAWADAAHDAGALLCVDATFATPLLQRPLTLGADIVMHSATKYLSGHADVTAGVLSTNDKALRDGLWQRRRNLGATLDPHAAYLLGRGAKTLTLRVERQCSNAWGLAQACQDLDGIAAVHYPGLSSHPDHAAARRLLGGGFGGMMTIDLGSKAKAMRFRRRLQVIAPAASLGGVESLCSLPLETSHRYMPAAQRRADGISDGLARISVGIEDIEDLIADLDHAVGR